MFLGGQSIVESPKIADSASIVAEKTFDNCYCNTVASHRFYLCQELGGNQFLSAPYKHGHKGGKHRDAPSSCTKEILLRIQEKYDSSINPHFVPIRALRSL